MNKYKACYGANKNGVMIRWSDSLEKIKQFTRAMERAGYIITVSEHFPGGAKIIYNTGEEWKK